MMSGSRASLTSVRANEPNVRSLDAGWVYYRNMVAIRIESAAPPWAHPEIAQEAAALLGRVEAMGLLDTIAAPITQIDTESMGIVFTLLRTRGLFRFMNFGALVSARQNAGEGFAEGAVSGTSDVLLRTLRQANEALENSAVPPDEWRHLRPMLGDELVGRLAGVSEPSVRRYAAGTRSTPDEVANRLHVVALLVADLSGAYNEFGIRRWFARRRTQLGGRSPLEILTSPWSPDDPAVAKLRGLARSITASPAA